MRHEVLHYSVEVKALSTNTGQNVLFANHDSKTLLQCYEQIAKGYNDYSITTPTNGQIFGREGVRWLGEG